jgi:hypothetical protein
VNREIPARDEREKTMSQTELVVTSDAKLATPEAMEIRLATLRGAIASQTKTYGYYAGFRLSNLAKRELGRLNRLKARRNALEARYSETVKGQAAAWVEAIGQDARYMGALLAPKSERGDYVPDPAKV